MIEPNSRRKSRRPGAGAPELFLALDPAAPRPLHRQVYDGLRSAILGGRLQPGHRVPSTRALAADLGVARNTIMFAFEELRTEGYLVTNRGGGTRVCRVLPDSSLSPARIPDRAAAGSASGPRPALAAPARRPTRLSRRGEVLIAAGTWASARAGSPPVPFRLGIPALDAFPVAAWARLARQLWRRRQVPLGEIDPGGEAALRAAIAAHVSHARAVRCVPDQVIVVTGTQHALDLAVRVLLDPGDAAWVEDPGYPDAAAVLRAAGARVVPVPVDGEGLDVAAGVRRSAHARFVCVTPSHQFPTGSVLSVARRVALLAWASRAGAWIFEDDYDSEFRYAGRPLPSLQGLDAELRPSGAPARVLYAGTFNKTLVPGLRLGYLIVPEELIGPLRAARGAIDRHASAFEQGVLAAFIGEGHYGRHVRRVRALYAERQAALLAAAREFLSGRLTLEPDPGGLHLIGWLPEGADEVEAAGAAHSVGIEVTPLSRYWMIRPARRARNGLVLGYAPFDSETIRHAARRLGRALGPPSDRGA